jgi:hypothetical protein
MGHGIEDDHELCRQVKRDQRLVAGCELEGFERDLVDLALEILRQVDARAPEEL